jgi:hypothetical protein
MAWTDFIELAQQDAADNNERGGHARDFIAALGHYMLSRFGTQDVTLLGDLIGDGGVMLAIEDNMAAVRAAETAVTSAAAAVIAARVELETM